MERARFAETTERVGIATGLTCPIIRYHPAIIAQAAATIGVMSEGRFALGAGERLNEHVVGYGWPPVHHRHAMLREAVEIMQGLGQGGLYSHSGEGARYLELSFAYARTEKEGLQLAHEYSRFGGSAGKCWRSCLA